MNSYASSGILKVNGGEFYAFKKTSGGGGTDGYIIYAPANAPIFTSQMSCPTSSRSGYTQVGAINDLVTGTAHASYSDTLTQLSISASGQNVRGTINASVQAMGVD